MGPDTPRMAVDLCSEIQLPRLLLNFGPEQINEFISEEFDFK